MSILSNVRDIIESAVARIVSDRVQQLEADLALVEKRMDALHEAMVAVNVIAESVEEFVDEVGKNRQLIGENRAFIGRLFSNQDHIEGRSGGSIFEFPSNKKPKNEPN